MSIVSAALSRPSRECLRYRRATDEEVKAAVQLRGLWDRVKAEEAEAKRAATGAAPAPVQRFRALAAVGQRPTPKSDRRGWPAAIPASSISARRAAAPLELRPPRLP